MNSDWATIPLGDVLTLQRGHDLPAQNRRAGVIPILGSSGITGYHNEAKAAGPGVTVGRSGNSMGDISYSDKDFWPLNTALYVTDFKGNDPKFIYYLLKTIDFDQFNSGSAQKSLNRNAVYPFEVKIPKSQAEQKRISSALSSLEDKVAINHQINQTLEQVAQAIFKSWFVDFEPVKAKIAALETGGSKEDALLAAMQAISGKDEAELTRLQAEQPEQYTELRATAELFPAAMQDSELGEIPGGWGARPFGDLLEKTIGGDWGKEEPDEKHTEMVKILRGTDLPNVYAGDDGKVPTRYVEPKKLKTRSLKPGDIVIEVSGGSKGQPTGRSLLLTSRLLERLGTCEPASFCRLFRPKDQETGLLLGLHLQHIYSEGKTWLYQNQSTGISNFQTKIFLEHELVATPPAELMHGFYKRVIPLIIRIHGDENAVLAELRDSLLPKLLSGELSVPSNLGKTASESLTAEQEAT